MKAVVSDTGPVLHLLEADALALLRHAGPILIPPAVDAEMAAQRPDWGTHRPKWIKVVSLHPRYADEARGWFSAGLLDSGEADAVSLARQVGARWLLSDDAAAALFAESLGLEVHGSLGVVLWCVAKGFLSEPDGRSALHGLKESSLWVSRIVMEEALAALVYLGASK